MSSLVWLIVAGLSFLGSATLSSMAVFKRKSISLGVLFGLTGVAVIAQLAGSRAIMFATNELHLSLAAAVLLVNSIIMIVLTLRSMRQLNLTILLVAYLFSGLLTLVMAFVPHQSLAFVGTALDHSVPLYAHIILSMAAYCVLVIAALYALQFRYIDAKLKNKTLSFNSHLPPLSAVENQQFKLLTIGTLLLTAALLTGFLFLQHMWAKEYAHKTLLSLIAWLMFSVITLGHRVYGWRSTRSAIATVIAAVVLTLAYFGSRFVREILINGTV